MTRRIIRAVALALLLLSPAAFADLSITFLDVGQGDAVLLLCDDEAMLIDGGSSASSQLIYSVLREQVDQLKLMIATHPHEDHIGGLSAALVAVPTDLILSPVLEWDSKSFESLQQYASGQGTHIITPAVGDTFTLGSAAVTILNCATADAVWTENDMSIVCRVDYGTTSFLFTGDAEWTSEYIMIDSGMPLAAGILKVGHHGSNTSSAAEFLEAISPSFAVISVGENNQYGHPSEEVLARLEDVGATVLRSDEMGSITIVSNGSSISISDGTTVPADLHHNQEGRDDDVPDAYIGNRNSMKFHYPDCPSVDDMNPKNKISLASREDAFALGFEPCGRCKP